MPSSYPTQPEYIPVTTDARDSVQVPAGDVIPGFPSSRDFDRLIGIVGANRGGQSNSAIAASNTQSLPVTLPAQSAEPGVKIISVQQQVILGIALLLLLYGVAKVRI